jgi:hypothetical protein
MQIQGPLRFSVAQDDPASGYELFLDFTEAFRTASLLEQGAQFRDYLRSISATLDQAGLDERNRQGLLMAQQIVEQLLPHVESGELALDETINIHVRPDSPQVSLIDLLRHGG